jgi:3-hydroxyacyl-[acyl-carrier-protein] dehydratase
MMVGHVDLHRVLAHRHPMLLVDRVVELVPDERIVAHKAVTGNEPWYAGVTGDLSYPSSLLLESWCQAAGVLAVWPPPEVADKVMVLGGATTVSFHRPVLPGDLVEHRIRITRVGPDNSIFDGGSSVRGTPVMAVERMVMALRPMAVLAQHDEQGEP